jgi:phytoene dehydrogenase-like protein
VKSFGGVVLTDHQVEKVLVDNNRAVGVRVKNGTEYRAKRGVISSIDAKSLHRIRLKVQRLQVLRAQDGLMNTTS